MKVQALRAEFALKSSELQATELEAPSFELGRPSFLLELSGSEPQQSSSELEPSSY